MKKIKMYLDRIKDELHGAKNYAECYVYYKTSKPEWSRKYHDMAMQELNHAQNFKDMGTQEYEEISKTYISQKCKEEWEDCMWKYADKVARIKMMLGA